MKILRTAIVGLGRIGWGFHLPQALRHPGFDLVAVVDPLQERLDEAEATFGNGAIRGYRDYRELLRAELLDLVVIASPTEFHAEQAIAAFEHGCDVFCDKPMATNLAEADRVIAAMKAHRRKLMIYQPHRALAETVTLRQVLARDLIGPIYMIKRARTSYVRRNDWQAFRRHGGGMLNNYGAHLIDQLLYLAGSPAKRICCALRNIASLGDAEDVVKVVIETESGIILDLDINQATAYPIPPWQIFGVRGTVILDEEARAWRVRYYREEEATPAPVYPELAAPGRRYPSDPELPWREEVFPVVEEQALDFYSCCYRYYALDEAPFVPIAESRELMRVLDACREDAGVGASLLDA